MRNRLGLLAKVCCCLGVMVVVGCGGAETTTTSTAPSGKDGLADLAEMLKQIAKDKKRPPANITEAAAYDPLYPSAYSELVGKKIVYMWGTGIDTGQTNVIAYEAKADTDGGWVLLQDGQLKQMSADEFKSAPKAKKK
jgi:hypothetical protein